MHHENLSRSTDRVDELTVAQMIQQALSEDFVEQAESRDHVIQLLMQTLAT